MVCANPDLVVMHGARLALCAGALAQWYEEMGGQVRWHGKPYRSVYDSCTALLGIADQPRILAVGDSLRTDIAGAQRRVSTASLSPAASMPPNSASAAKASPIWRASTPHWPPVPLSGGNCVRSPSPAGFPGSRPPAQ